ncbi:MAG: VOC family protein [Burkholderiaceae bacterium]
MTAKPSVPPVPAPNGTLPYLTIRDAAGAIEFYKKAFAAEQIARLDAPDGVMHCELSVGGARFMLTEERPQYKALSPLSLNGSGSAIVVYVPDADATVKLAVEAGAKVDMPVADQFWGDRSGSITDPYGHKWMVATQKEILTEAELNERAAKMFEKGGPC